MPFYAKPLYARDSVIIFDEVQQFPRARQLITEKRKIAPIEVKSGSYKSHSSLDKFKRKYTSKIGNSYILYTKDVMVKDDIIHLPVYMTMFL